jgi:hypothetical protein
MKNTTRVIISEQVEWGKHVACMWGEERLTGSWRRKFKERDHMEDRRRWEDNIRMSLK